MECKTKILRRSEPTEEFFIRNLLLDLLVLPLTDTVEYRSDNCAHYPCEEQRNLDTFTASERKLGGTGEERDAVCYRNTHENGGDNDVLHHYRAAFIFKEQLHTFSTLKTERLSNFRY